MPRHRTALTATISAPAGYIYAVVGERRRAAGAAVSEPEPGRVLLERDPASGQLTTFTVEPLPTGASAVTICTDVTVRGGVRGVIERRVIGWLLLRACRRELASLAVAIASPAGADGWSLTVRRPAAPPRAQVTHFRSAHTV